MATYSSIDTYKNPEQLSIANTLGTAVSYLQKNYDQNVQQTQALIQQYVGTDLLRDVDKEYLGERLGTLVNYINQSGNRNWTKTSVAQDIGSYISSAIDENVIQAVGSTQAYRKQMAEIEAYKKAGKGEYAVQNQWAATRDLSRYLESKELGDRYNPGVYMPYRNVNEKILKNLDKIKEMGVEYVPYEGQSDGYFRTIGTREVLTPGQVQGALGAILDSTDMQQLQIDGLYSMKDLDDETIKQKYVDTFDTKINLIDENLEAARVQVHSLQGDQKNQLLQKINAWETERENLNVQKQKDLTRDSMAASMYTTNYISQWSNFASFDRVTDFKIDDSELELAKYKNELAKDERDYNLEIAKLEQDAALKGFKRNSDGSLEVDLNNPMSGNIPGVSVHDSETPLEEQENTNTVMKESRAFTNSYFKAREAFETQFIKGKLLQPGNEHLREKYGNANINTLIGVLVNSPSKSVDLYNALPPEVKQAVDQARGNKKIVDQQNPHLDAIIKETDKYAAAIDTAKDNYKDMFQRASFGFTIDDNGNLVKGDILKSKGKYSEFAKQLVQLNLEIDDKPRNSEDREIMVFAFKKKVLENKNLTSKQKANIIDNLMYSQNAEVGVLNSVGNVVSKAGAGIASLFRGEGWDTGAPSREYGDNQVSWAEDSWGKILRAPYTNTRPSELGGGSWFGLGKADIGVKNIAESRTNIKEQMNAMKTGAANRSTLQVGKSLKIDIKSKSTEPLVTAVKASLPQGSVLASDSFIEIKNINANTGLAELSVPLKNGKEISIHTQEIPISQIPQALLQNYKLMENANSVYNASSPKAVGYAQNYKLPTTIDDIQDLNSSFSIEDITTGKTPKHITKSEYIQEIQAILSPEVVQRHAQSIQSLLNAHYEVRTIPVNGQWVTQVLRDGKQFDTLPMGSETYNPNQIALETPNIIKEAIMKRVGPLVGY